MVKTIDKKVLSEERKNRGFLNLLAKRLKLPKYAPDLSDEEVCRTFAIRYGRAIAPELRKIDQLQARSMGHMFTIVIRGGYSYN